METRRTEITACSTSLQPRLGVDIGRVIIEGDGPDTSFVGGSDDDALRAPAVDGAFAALTRLCARFDGRVWLVSKCGQRVEARTRAWLAHHRFFAITGVDPANVVFVRTRPEKAPVCARLGITCFLDDRLDILDSMRGIVAMRVLFGAARAPSRGVSAAIDWHAAEQTVLEAMA